MARGKKTKNQAEAEPTTPDTPVQNTEETTKVSKRFYFYDYIAVAVFFCVFMLIQKQVTWWFMNPDPNMMVEKSALDFFFNTMMVGFVFVVVLVWLHDFFYRDVESDDTT